MNPTKTVHLTFSDIKTTWGYYCFNCGTLVAQGEKHTCPTVIDVTWRDAPEQLPAGDQNEQR